MPSTMSMVSQFLTPDELSIVGDKNKTIATLRVGVPEGPPLSPLLLNIFMDTITVELASAPP